MSAQDVPDRPPPVQWMSEILARETLTRYAPRPTPPGPLAMPVRERKEPKGLRRGKPLNKRNPERLAKRKAETFSDCARMSRLLPCCCCGRAPRSEASHVVSRGAGGKDTANVVPMCRTHHHRMSAPGWSARRLEEQFRISFEVVASYVADMVREHECNDYPKLGRDARVLCQVCLAVLDPDTFTP